MEDDEGSQGEREIWEVTHVSDQKFQTTEGEDVDFPVELLDLVGLTQVKDNETEKNLS